PGEAGDGEAAGAIAGAHGVLVLAPAHGLGVGVEGETEAGGDVGRRPERDLAARRRDGLRADAADGVAQTIDVSRRDLDEVVAVRDGDGAPVRVGSDDDEAMTLRRADERELRKAAPHDEDPRHDAAPFARCSALDSASLEI